MTLKEVKCGDVAKGGVHLSIGYFCLESEKNSGIWHYNFCRSMLHGFVCGLRHELPVPFSSSRQQQHQQRPSQYNIQYVNMWTHEDYAKRSSGAAGANTIHNYERVKDVCPVAFFKRFLMKGGSIYAHQRSCVKTCKNRLDGN